MVALLLALLVGPSPSPTPLKTIEHVYSSRFCTALRQNIAHAIGAILSNHDVIVSGKIDLLDLARAQVYRANPRMVTDVEMVKIDRVIGDMVKNLAVADGALNDLQRLPNDATNNRDLRLQLMRQQLRAVADRQRNILNVFSGLYESYSSNELAGRGNPLGGALDRHAPSDSDSIAPFVVSPQTSAGSTATSAHQPLVTSVPVPQVSVTPTPVPEVDIGLAGVSPHAQAYARLFNAVTTYQIREQLLESQASQTILTAAADCNSQRK